MTLRIGLDFDNTLIDYDAAFAAEAIRQGMLPPGTAGGKAVVKRALLAAPGGERGWMRVQGQVYGVRIGEGRLIDGVAAFLEAARRLRARVAVVSHKTRFGHFDETRTDLRMAALAWMRTQGFFHRYGIAEEDVHFAATREAKIARIAELGLDVFVDDLPEVLADPDFPAGVRRVLFAPCGGPAMQGVLECRDWTAIREAVLAG